MRKRRASPVRAGMAALRLPPAEPGKFSLKRMDRGSVGTQADGGIHQPVARLAEHPVQPEAGANGEVDSRHVTPVRLHFRKTAIYDAAIDGAGQADEGPQFAAKARVGAEARTEAGHRRLLQGRREERTLLRQRAAGPVRAPAACRCGRRRRRRAPRGPPACAQTPAHRAGRPRRPAPARDWFAPSWLPPGHPPRACKRRPSAPRTCCRRPR